MTTHKFFVLSVLILGTMRADGMFVCPTDGMFENSDDAGSFWHCAHGTGYLKPCPAALMWSQELQTCVWNVNPTTVVTSTQPPTTIPTTTTPSILLPAQCSAYTSINDVTRRRENTLMNAETDHTFFSSKPTWVRFEGDGGTRLAESSVPSSRCGSEGAGWLKHPAEVTVGKTVNQTACFNWNGMSCIWPLKVPMTNCNGYFVYALVAPSMSNARYCTV